MNILFICTGNTCRSPMAEGYLESKNLPDLKIESRGLSGDGAPVSQNSKNAMAELGIDISFHKSRQLTSFDLGWADKIIYMSPAHKTVLSLYTAENKLFMLGDGIPDPYGGSIEDYRLCRDEIIKAIDALIAENFFSEILITAVKREHLESIAELEKVCFSTPWSIDAVMEHYSAGTKFFVAVMGEKVLGYIGISTVIEMGEYIRKTIREQNVSNYVQNYIVDSSEFKEIPESVYEYQKNNMLASYSEYADYYGVTVDQLTGGLSLAELLEQNKESIEAQTKFALAVQALSESNADLRVNEQTAKGYYLANFGTEDYSQVSDTYGEPYLFYVVMNEYVIEYLMENIVYEDTTLNATVTE